MATNVRSAFPSELSQSIKPLLLNKQFDRKRAVIFFYFLKKMLWGFFIPVKDTAILQECLTQLR